MKRAALAWALGLSLHTLPASGDGARDADRLFEEGKQLFDRGNFAAACSRFEASLAMQPGIGARLWLADCYESLGRTASAQRQFTLAAREAQKAGDKRAQVAQRRADTLEARVVKIVVTVEHPTEGERVDVDGLAVASGQEPVAVDPGRHLVTATAPGRAAWEVSFDATSPDHRVTVVVPELGLPPRQESPPPPPTRASLPPAPEPDRLDTRRIAGGVTAGVGALSLAAGSVLAILAIRDNGSSRDGCDTTCTPEAHDQRLRAIHEANAATVTFIAGGALVATGAVLFFLGSHVASTPSVAIAPSASGARAILRFW
jgi:hypothetical protein